MRFRLSRPMTCVGPVPVSVIKRVVSWNKSSSYWDTSPCKRPSDTSDAKPRFRNAVNDRIGLEPDPPG